jgi:hypothetical protein
MGRPSGGHPLITDLAVFQDRLYLTTSVSPLGSFGASVFVTSDGQSFDTVINDSSSQGFLRLRVLDGTLYIPDGDPNGYDPGYVYVTNGGQLQQTVIPNAVHTFDVAAHAGDVLASNGMASGKGSLCKSSGTSWPEVVATPYGRLRYMASFGDALYVGKSAVGSNADYLRWTGDVDASQGQPVDVVSGEAVTFRWFASEQGRLLWAHAAAGAFHVRQSEDGTSWSDVSSLDGEFVSDFVDFGGKVYALGNSGLWESDDGGSFDLVVPAPGEAPFEPHHVGQGISVDGMASLEAYDGSIWAGSSVDGSLYRIE